MSSIKKDFIYKLSTGIIRIPANFLLQFFYARILGPASYGNFDYVLNAANKILAFFDSGSSKAFFVKLSSDNKSSIFSLYFFLLSIFLLVLNLFFTGLYYFLPSFFPNDSLNEIILITNLSGFIYILNAIYSSIDALKKTVFLEKFKIIVIFLTLILFTLFYFISENFSTVNFVLIHLSVNIISVIYLSHNQKIFKRIYNNFYNSFNTKNYNYFLLFIKPLFFYGLVTTLVPLFERWLLQFFNDSVELGYFSIAFKLAVLILVFTSAFIPLFSREISILYSKKKSIEIRNLYTKTLKRLFFLTFIISILISNFSEEIINLIGGNIYADAILVLNVMCFYPVLQTLGQINGSYFYSTKKIKTYSNIGIYCSPISIILIWIFVAPNQMYGLDLGAIGLAIYYVIYGLFVVFVQQFYISKYAGIIFKNIISFQLIIFFLIYSLNYFINSSFLFEFNNPFLQKIISNLIFVIIVLLMVIYKSNYFLNISYSEIKTIFKKII